MAIIVKDRIYVRISKEQKDLIKSASELRGFNSLTEFVVFCINAEANKIINENNVLLKSMDDKRVLVDALLNAPVPNEKLLRAQDNL